MNKLTIGSIILSLSTAWGAPTVYPKDFNLLRRVSNATTSNIIGDSVDLRTVYVMPPNVATATVHGLHTITSNNGYCAEMADLQKYSKRTVEMMNKLTDELVDRRSTVDEINERLRKARDEMAKYTVEAKIPNIKELDEEIEQSEKTLDDLNKNFQKCLKSCEKISSDIDNAESTLKALTREKRTLVRSHAEEYKIYVRKKAAVSEISDELSEENNRYSKLLVRLEEVKKSFNGMYVEFAKMEGARAAFSYVSDWDKNVDTLRNMNPGCTGLNYLDTN